MCSTSAAARVATDRIVESPFMDSNPYSLSLHQRLAATFDWYSLQAPTSACKTVSTQTLNRTVSLLGVLNIDVFGIGNIGSVLFQKELRLARGMTFCLQNLVSRSSGVFNMFSMVLTLFRLGIIPQPCSSSLLCPNWILYIPEVDALLGLRAVPPPCPRSFVYGPKLYPLSLPP